MRNVLVVAATVLFCAAVWYTAFLLDASQSLDTASVEPASVAGLTPPPIAAAHGAAPRSQSAESSGATTRHDAVVSLASCGEIPAPGVPFQQVESRVGPVPIDAIAQQLAHLADADPSVPGVPGLYVVFFALDGTLLNLLRWGRIVNDNDIDLGFYLVHCNDGRGGSVDATEDALLASTGAAAIGRLQRRYHSCGDAALLPLPYNLSDPLCQYRVLQRWLFARGLIRRELMPRDEAKLHHARKSLKPQSCKHRGQMMQCRLDDTPVVLDWFGVETLHSAVSGLALSDVLPVVACKAFRGIFPCPRRAVHTLRTFSLNVGSAAMPQAYIEFGGCALFPRRQAERDRAHVESVLRTATMLRDCKFPSLIDQIHPLSPSYEGSCTAIVDASGARSLG